MTRKKMTRRMIRMGSRMGREPLRYQKFGENAPHELVEFITARYGQHVMVRVERFPARNWLDKYKRLSYSVELVYAEAAVPIRGWGRIKYAIRDPFCYWQLDPLYAKDWRKPEQMDDLSKGPGRKPWLRALSKAREGQ